MSNFTYRIEINTSTSVGNCLDMEDLIWIL